MTIAHIEDTGDVTSELLEIAREDQTANFGIITTDDEQKWAYSYSVESDHVTIHEMHHEPLKAADLLFTSIEVGEKWDDGGMLLVGTPHFHRANMHLEEALNEAKDEPWTVESGYSDYRSVDDHTSRALMMYHKDDLQRIGGHEFTRPWAEENPGTYIMHLLRADATKGAYLLKDTDLESTLGDLGFQQEGDYEMSMHASRGSTSPSGKRAELTDEGFDVVIVPSSRTQHNPFTTRFQVWTRPEEETVRA
jgi:hypothetical protein